MGVEHQSHVPRNWRTTDWRLRMDASSDHIPNNVRIWKEHQQELIEAAAEYQAMLEEQGIECPELAELIKETVE